MDIKRRLDELEAAMRDFKQTLDGFAERLAFLEKEKLPEFEDRMQAHYHRITAEMHDSLLSTSRATCDAMRADITNEMRRICSDMINAHCRNMHPYRPPFEGTTSGSATDGSS